MNLSERDAAHIWHPYTQMQTAPLPVGIVRGQGALLFDEEGNALIDAISSWWVNAVGHANPVVAEAIATQAKTLEQVIFAGFTHAPAVTLAEKICDLLAPSLNRVFFSDNGSTAVEVALKMAWQYYHNRGEARQTFLAFEEAYHGDTFGAMSVSGRSIFTKAFDPLLFDIHFLPNPSRVSPAEMEAAIRAVCAEKKAAACIVEPLVMGAGGMLMYSPEMLSTVFRTCAELDVLRICDEVMTGFYRTGKRFAHEYVAEVPDIVCLSKALTGGFLPLGLTVCSEELYQAFLSEDRMKTLFHGHSYTANPLACAAANATLELLESAEYQQQIARICRQQAEAARYFGLQPWAKSVRVQGTILALNVEFETKGGYLAPIGQKLFQAFLAKGILLRLLGDVLYILPPYVITEQELQAVYSGVGEVMAEF